MDYKKIISDYVDNHQAEMLEAVKTVVNMEGHFTEKANVEKVRDWFQQQFEQEGFNCKVHEVAPNRAGILVGILGADRPGKPVLFSGHLDTVFHAGAYGRSNPFKQDGDTLYGPGVHDMKPGIVIALYAVKALNAAGWKDRPVKIMLVCEEESDHIGNHADEFITEQSRDVLCAFNMEGGEMTNQLCIGRKCQLTYYMTVHGVGGHAGNDFLIGKNAINETALKLAKIIKLTDVDKGTTVTPATIKGGIHVCSIPDECETAIDIRIDSEAEHDRIVKQMAQIMAHTFIPGTQTTYHLDMAQFKPYTETPAISAFHAFICHTAEQLGLPPFGKIHSGGAADSGNIAYAGVPVLCGCGIMGGFSHSLKEYASLASLYDRTKVYALAVTQLENFIY